VESTWPSRIFVVECRGHKLDVEIPASVALRPRYAQDMPCVLCPYFLLAFYVEGGTSEFGRVDMVLDCYALVHGPDI